MRRLIPAALAASGLALGLAGVASADSIVFVKDANVWIAKPDGSNQYQVTRDGTAAQPYSSPSQADDGTIAASFGSYIVRMRQNGSVLNRMDPPPLMNSVGNAVDGTPTDIAISPDGARIAYTFVDAPCQVGSSGCDARPATTITPADRIEPSASVHTFDSSWVTNDRILAFAPFPGQVNTLDVGQDVVRWFDDNELVVAGSGTDQSDGEVNRQGTYVATIRGSGNARAVMWLRLRGNVQTGSRAAGTLLLPDPKAGCVTTATAAIAGPTWSPSGTALAWYEAGAIHVWDDVNRCAGASSKPVIADGSEPDWGPADVNPGLREGEAPPNPPGNAPNPPAGDPKKTAPKSSSPKPTLKLAANVRLKTALKRGFRVRVTGGKAGPLTVVAKQGGKKVASGKGKLSAKGSATVTLRFTSSAKRRLARHKRISLKLSAGDAAGTVTLKR